MAQSKENLVLDFDGTLTDLQKEAQPYIDVYRGILAGKLGMERSDLEAMLEETKRRVIENPQIYGWQHNGLIVAPATADPYILNRVVVQESLAELDPKGRITTDDLQAIHEKARKQKEIIFREGARDFLRMLGEHYRLRIITTSERQGCINLLDGFLGPNHGISVIGGVKKYEIDLTWTQVSKTYQPEGFPRPVQLRRRDYWESLLPQISGVVGDVFELDLALPDALGIRTILLLTEGTPLWERHYYRNQPNRSSGVNLGEITKIL